MKSDIILFKEGQKIGRFFLAFLFVFMLAAMGLVVYLAYKDTTNKSELVLSLAAILAFEIPIFSLFYFTNFETIVTTAGIGYRWWPLQRKFRMVMKESISSVSLRKSPALTYGIHWLPGYGWVNNMKGRNGIQLRLKSGKRIYIGSSRIEELRTSIEKLFNKSIGELRDEF